MPASAWMSSAPHTPVQPGGADGSRPWCNVRRLVCMESGSSGERPDAGLQRATRAISSLGSLMPWRRAVVVAVIALPGIVAVAVNASGAFRGSTDAERAALYAVEGSDPPAATTVTCGQRWLRPAALVGRVTYDCTHWSCTRNTFDEITRRVEIGRSTISHTPLDGWHYVLHGSLRDHAVRNSGSTEPFKQTASC
jgi:hypothetical protein